MTADMPMRGRLFVAIPLDYGPAWKSPAWTGVMISLQICGRTPPRLSPPPRVTT